ncbi:hypothetical protein GCM10007863_29490 [Dyella mobilis]|nr:hypothetical protein GCM10007863_29490 [Dyella mobilis]
MALASLPGGYVARKDFEQIFGEQAEGDRTEKKPYVINLRHAAERNYQVSVNVQPLTEVPFSSAPSSRLVNTTPSSELYVEWRGHECLPLEKVQSDLAAIGIVLNEWVVLPDHPGAPPMPPGGYFYRPNGKEFVRVMLTSPNFNPKERSEWEKACVEHLDIEGYKIGANAS